MYIINKNGFVIADDVVYEEIDDHYEVHAYVQKIGFGNLMENLIISSEICGLPVTKIQKRAFINKRDLEYVTIPNSIKVIEAKAFFGCNALKTLTIPDSVEEIQDSAFWMCDSLEDLYLPKLKAPLRDCLFLLSKKEGDIFSNSCFPTKIHYPGTKQEFLSMLGGIIPDVGLASIVTDPEDVQEIGLINGTRIPVKVCCSDESFLY